MPKPKSSTTTTTRKNSKAKKPKVVSESAEESSDSSEEEAGGVGKKVLTKIAVPSIRSNATDNLARARISINRMNLLSPPLPLLFGQWNDRSLVDKHVKVLQSSFQTQGVRAFEMENMIPLVIRKDHLDSNCLNVKSLDAAEAPFLRLSSEGLKAPSIKVAGGRHRFQAVKLESERLSMEIKRLEGKIKGDDAATEEQQDMDRAIKATIQTLSNEKERVCIWGIVIYDEEALLADGELLVTELSRNEKKLQYAESDSESLLMTFRTWRGLKGDQADEYLKSLGKNLNSSLAQVMNHQESREFLMALDDLQPHFYHTEPFTTTWIKRYIHGISGGIVVYLSLYGVRLWKSLLSKVNRFATSDVENWDAYLTALGQSPAKRPEGWNRKAVMTWKTVAEPEHVAKLNVHRDLLSVAMMSRFRNVDSAQIRRLLTNTPSQAPSDWQEYSTMINEVYNTNMEFEPVDDDTEQEIGSMFLKKVEFFLTDHKDAHYAIPMPMLTTTVILELTAMMQTIEPAVIEFARWFDPYAEYFYQNHKNTETPKDLTAHALRTISTNAGNVFSQPDNAARELAHIPLKYYAAFLKLTEDIKAFGPKCVRPRTTPEQKLDALEKKHKGVTEGVESLKKLMKANKKGGLTGNWVLDFVGIYDWRNGTKIKNVGRDFIRWAIPAYVEVDIVNSYRPTLLKESQAARYLRFVSAETLLRYAKPVNRIDSAASYASSQRYLYPDRLEATTASEPIAAPEVHVTDLMERMQDDEELSTSLKELAREVKRIVKLRCLSAKPDCTEMSPSVHIDLEKFIQSATRNAYRLRDMKAEQDPSNVDPLDEKWMDYAERIVCDLPTIWSKESIGSQVLARRKAKTSVAAEENINRDHGMCDDAQITERHHKDMQVGDEVRQLTTAEGVQPGAMDRDPLVVVHEDHQSTSLASSQQSLQPSDIALASTKDMSSSNDHSRPSPSCEGNRPSTIIDSQHQRSTLPGSVPIGITTRSNTNQLKRKQEEHDDNRISDPPPKKHHFSGEEIEEIQTRSRSGKRLVNK